MLNSAKPLVYWDACVMLEYINDQNPNRMSHIQGLLQDPDIQLVTSILSIVEVAKAKYEQDNALLDPDAEAKIDKLWEDGSPIEVVEFYELIAEDARALMRKATPLGWSLKPPDAIHLATADRLKVSAFHTYDGFLAKYSGLTSTRFPITEPIANQPTVI